MIFLWLVPLVGVAAALLFLARAFRRRRLDRWLASYLLGRGKRRRPRPGEPVHVLLCVADHFEPDWHAGGPEEAMARVRRWVREYPERFGGLRDSDGRPPQHTFFYPMETYNPA